MFNSVKRFILYNTWSFPRRNTFLSKQQYVCMLDPSIRDTFGIGKTQTFEVIHVEEMLLCLMRIFPNLTVTFKKLKSIDNDIKYRFYITDFLGVKKVLLDFVEHYNY